MNRDLLRIRKALKRIRTEVDGLIDELDEAIFRSESEPERETARIIEPVRNPHLPGHPKQYAFEDRPKHFVVDLENAGEPRIFDIDMDKPPAENAWSPGVQVTEVLEDEEADELDD